MRHIPLTLGYTVVIAPAFAGLGAAMRVALEGDVWESKGHPTRRCLVVTNEIVDSLHGASARDALAAAGWLPVTVRIPEGERHKTTETWLALVDAILDVGIDRRTPIVALGGGVVGDVAGFAAATLLRGVPIIQVPTTLLAMVDASVGGKTGVNGRQGKNLIGAFHQPRLVWAAVSALTTLPVAEVRCGLGEIVKHAVIDGEAAFAALESSAGPLSVGDPTALVAAIEHSVTTKARIVDADPHERGPRAVLNLGHTVGHAIEAVAGFGVVPHGQAVALGLLAEARWAAHNLPGAGPALPARVERLLGRLGLAVRPPSVLDVEALVAAIAFDKKRAHAMVQIAVPVAVGDVRLHLLPLSAASGLIRALWEA